MSVLLSMVLAASPAACEQVYPKIWDAWQAREVLAENPPRFEKVPDAKERVQKSWVAECAALDATALECASGERLERELAQLELQSKAQKIPRDELEVMVAKRRKAFKPLSCDGVGQAIDRAIKVVESALRGQAPPTPRKPDVPDAKPPRTKSTD